jgi:hypothetical protein
MNREEQIVERYLRHEGHAGVSYEPNGNVPPDFAIDNRIAVEVRRLNQQYETPTGRTGLEEDAIPIRRAFLKTLESLGPPIDGTSWFVGFHLRRPFDAIEEIPSRLRNYLESWTPGAGIDLDHEVARGVFVHIIQASDPHPQRFLLGSWSDWDSGGWLVSETIRNVRLCVEEKTRKIQNYVEQYTEWWLALVDNIGYGFDGLDRDQLRGHLTVPKPWNRIIIVDSANLERSLDADDP